MNNQKSRYSKTINALVFASAIFLGQSNAMTGNKFSTTEPTPLTKNAIIYQYDEMFNFSIDEYLAKNAPHLLPHAEAISHYAGRSTISPKVLIALIEQQSGLFSSEKSYKFQSEMPFGTLSTEIGFNKQLEDISDRISQAFYDGHSYAETGINAKLTNDSDAQRAIQVIFSNGIHTNKIQPGSADELDDFYRTYHKLFPSAQNELEAISEPVEMFAPSSNFLQLPWPVGSTWTFGGSHTNTGSGSYPQSSLDLNNGGRWGDNLTGLWVTAAAAGRVVRHSSCSLEVVHSGGWSTTYYHLSGIRVSHGANISRNTKIANYASNKNQALCNGGQSSGPHVHFSLKQNGQFYHLNGVSLSGFQVRTGRDSYDGNCNYFWLAKNNAKNCAWSRIYNSGVSGGTDPGDTIWDMTNGQVRSNISGASGVKYYYKISVPSGKSRLTIQSYNGSGDADLYVRYGSLPTTSTYYCRPWKNGNNETCTINNPSSGTWYIMLNGYSAFSGLYLKTTYN